MLTCGDSQSQHCFSQTFARFGSDRQIEQSGFSGVDAQLQINRVKCNVDLGVRRDVEPGTGWLEKPVHIQNYIFIGGGILHRNWPKKWCFSRGFGAG